MKNYFCTCGKSIQVNSPSVIRCSCGEYMEPDEVETPQKKRKREEK